ncbi:MAG: GNAT family N-acetyltransferase [Anaerolineales bacterium]
MKTKSELFIRDLGDGLILRQGSVEDADALADINSRMHSDEGPDQPELGIGAWIRDLVAKPHPTLVPSDFTVVEETSTGKIVSTLCLIPQTWTFDSIEFGVGRPELVCTLPEFRKRGLIRVQMEEVHKWSAERGHLAQVITGIPYFYRQFGYDMALNLSGARRGFEPHVPALKDGESEPFNIRPATQDDADFILTTYEAHERKQAISCKRTSEIMRYEMHGKDILNLSRYEFVVIEDKNGKRLGFFEHSIDLWFGGIGCVYFAVAEGVSWLAVSPSVVHYMWKKGAEYAERKSTTRTAFSFNLGEHHPVYDVLDDKLPTVRKPYAYYVRVPDVTAFLNKVKPALERRLAESVAVGYSGELRVSFYKDGFRMVFDNGKITLIESVKHTTDEDVDVAFPEFTFLHVLFGHRSLDELRHAFVDCYVNTPTARVLVNALFPKRDSFVQAVS